MSRRVNQTLSLFCSKSPYQLSARLSFSMFSYSFIGNLSLNYRVEYGPYLIKIMAFPYYKLLIISKGSLKLVCAYDKASLKVFTKHLSAHFFALNYLISI